MLLRQKNEDKYVKKLGKIGLLILSLMIYIFIAVVLIFFHINERSTNKFVFALGVIAFLAIPFECVFYIINLFRNTSVPKDRKTLWLVLLIGWHFLIFPFYWYFHIWRDSIEGASASSSAPSISSAKCKEKAPYLKKPTARNILLVASLLPIVFMLLAAGIVYFTGLFTLAYICGALYFISMLILIILYSIDVYRNPAVAPNQRIIWTVMLTLGTIVVSLVYWYIYIWQKSRNEPPTSESTPQATN
jgi:hypothetical protein